MEETKKTNRVALWVRGHLWLLAVIAGCLVFLSFCGPFLFSKPLTFVGWNLPSEPDGYGYAQFSVSGSLTPVWASGLLNPVVWPIWLEFGLILFATVLAAFGFKNKYFSFFAMLLFLVAGILFLTNASFYDFTQSAQYVPSGLADAGDGQSDVLDCYLPAFSSLSGTKLAFGSVYGAFMSFVASFLAFDEANSKETYSIRDMTEIGILVAAAIGLHYIKIPIGLTGGSINLAPIPLFLVALRHGGIKGFFASGIIYGLIACAIGQEGLITYPLDYLIGFGSMGILGFFGRWIFVRGDKGWSPLGFVFIFVGVVLATLVRFMGSTASSMINYGLSFTAALIYNEVYIPVTAAVALVAMEVMYIPLAKLNKHFPVAQRG